MTPSYSPRKQKENKTELYIPGCWIPCQLISYTPPWSISGVNIIHLEEKEFEWAESSLCTDAASLKKISEREMSVSHHCK